MAKRYGTVIVLRDGLTKAEAEEFMRRVREMPEVEINDFGSSFHDRTILSPSVQEYDDKWGSGPVWYIP